MTSTKKMAVLSAQGRLRAVQMDYACSGGHVGGSLSCMDILVALHHGILRGEQDLYFHSKGHCAEALYVVLAQLGHIDDAELDTYCQDGSRLYGHPTNHVPGVLVNTGALGHGLPIAVGAAIGQRKDGKGGRSYVMMGDGELGEGSIFEAMAAAAHYGLDNLTAIVDRNHLQISGNTEDVLAAGNLAAKAIAYGWDCKEVDGNDLDALMDVFTAPRESGKPLFVIAHTTKGKGVSYMENNASWHHGVMSADQFGQACQELEMAVKEAQKHEA